MTNLPEIKNHPTKKITLPVSKKKVTVRPFLVGEEKVLIMLRENEDSTSKDFLNGMCQIIDSCVTEKINPRSLTEVDISYMFLNIRMLSKGESSKVSYICKATTEDDEECGTQLDINLDLNKVELYEPEGFTTLFKVANNDIHVQMRVPTIEDAMKFEEVGIQLDDVSALKWKDFEFLITHCIDSIIVGTKDDSNVIKDTPREELVTWLEKAPDSFIEDIVENYIQVMPFLRYHVEIECPSCGTKHNFDITGVDNFFE